MESIEEIQPVVPVAPYQGGKRNLAKEIIKRINQVPHAIYAEPFVGMGGVFLRRTYAPKSEIINDLNSEIVIFFRHLQRHYAAFMEMMKFQITSRQEFERLCNTDIKTLTELERAARFFYLQRTSFGGKVTGQNFGVSVKHAGSFDINKLGPMLDSLHSRLSGVVIECLPYQGFIKRYDRTETLFYLDPPYFGCETDYGKDTFSPEDFVILAGLLKTIKGRFILSLNDVPEIRDIFRDFTIEGVKTTYSIGPGSKKVGEVIISN